MEIGLSLGSNLNHRLENLREATNRVEALSGTRIVAKAPVYETEPVGVKQEYATLHYLNTVVIIETDMALADLSNAIHQIEADMGRIRTEDRHAPRAIDIDVLYAGELERADGILDLPHPRWAQRRFVVQPLADVRPHLRLPGDSRQISEVLKSLPTATVTLYRAKHQW